MTAGPEYCTMRMACKEIRQPIVYVIREVKLGEFLKQCSLSDSIESLCKIKRQDNDVGFSGQEIDNCI